MANMRNDSNKVAEAYRQADLIVNRCAGRSDASVPPDTDTRQRIADALLDIWQEDYTGVFFNTEVIEI